MVDNKQEPWYYYQPSAVIPKNIDYKYLNLMTPFLLSLVISFMGSQLKTLIMSWYKCMTPFRNHLQLVIEKYLFQFNDSFPSIEYKSNEELLIGMSRYIIFSLTLMFFIFGNYLFDKMIPVI